MSFLGALAGIFLVYSYFYKHTEGKKIIMYGGGALGGALVGSFISGVLFWIVFAAVILYSLSFFRKK